jgi:hypothetical protein
MANSLIIPYRFAFIFFKTDLISNLVGRLSDVDILAKRPGCQRNPARFRVKHHGLNPRSQKGFRLSGWNDFVTKGPSSGGLENFLTNLN